MRKVDEESPIVFYHSFEPKYAEVFCRLLEERFRENGGKREIEFRRQEGARGGHLVEVIPDAAYGKYGGSMWVGDDDQLEMGDICCSDLLTMTSLYYTTENISTISPFIDTDNMFPELLEQGRIKEDISGLPILVFAGAAEGFQTFLAAMNSRCYGLKGLDCLDLMMLMKDSDFLFDVCMTCNAGDETPHVCPADMAAFARLAEKDPGVAAVFDWIRTGGARS